MNIAREAYLSKRQETKSVIETMMTEKVGHLLDSGAIYGRAYQQRIDSNFTTAPNAVIIHDDWSGFDVKASLYHHLCRTVLFNSEKQQEFDSFAQLHEDLTWSDIIAKWEGHTGYDFTEYFDSLDMNNCSFLDGVFYAWVIEDNQGNEFVLIRTHNGCDYRGGYSKPYMFDKCSHRNFDNSGLDCDLFRVADVDIICKDNVEHHWMHEGFGKFLDDSWPQTELRPIWNGQFYPCPKCGGKLVADM